MSVPKAVEIAGGDADDLASLPFLTEDVLNQELKLRYRKSKIYTYVGDILIILNPFQDLGLYTNDVAQRYRSVLRADVPPHAFAVADAAYTGVNQSGKAQVCIVSGESGAGKTETTKHLVRHILMLAHGGTSGLQGKILQTSPILEAFGNAQTVMNHNSSRFGKYMEIKFDGTAQVIGIGLLDYLLERPRVVRQGIGERGFHIFYYLLTGMDQASRDALRLGTTHRQFAYLSSTQQPVDAAASKRGWAEVQHAFHSIGFNPNWRDDISAVLAGILHLGNCGFHDTGLRDDSCELDEPAQLEFVAMLFRVDARLLQAALMQSVSVLRGETIVKPLSTSQSTDNRDALAKTAYGKIFSWLVATASTLIDQSGDRTRTSIGLLDIFGFENFNHNGFEQMCINLANERLQFYFNEHIFKGELAEYEAEGLIDRMINVSYVDNEPVLRVFSGKPLGIFAILNEEAKLRSSTAQSLIQKLQTHIGSSPLVEVASDSFTVKHYAGAVTYSASEMIVKNRDDLPAPIVDALVTSECGVIQRLFVDNGKKESKASVNTKKSSRKPLISFRRGAPSKHRRRHLPQSVALQFSNSLTQLVNRMKKAEPHFLRCIKPNADSRPSHFNAEYVMDQLRYTGVLETVRIRREGFSARLLFADFISRFGILGFFYASPVTAKAEHCIKVLKHAQMDGYVLGRTKVFLKYWAMEQLSQKIRDLGVYAIRIQALVRGWGVRRAYARLQQQRMMQQTAATMFFEALSESTRLLAQRLNDLEMQDDARNPEELNLALPRLPQVSFKGARRKASSKLPEFGTRAYKSQLLRSRKASKRWFDRHESKRFEKATVYANDTFPPVWFHEMISREEAEVRLQGTPYGTYLVRVSETAAGYSLSVKDYTVVRNYKITVNEDLTYTTVNAPRPFDTLQELIDHYHTDILTDDGLVLLQPLPRPVYVESADGIEYAQVKFLDGNTVLVAPNGNIFEVESEADIQATVDAASADLLAMAGTVQTEDKDKVTVALVGSDYRVDAAAASVIEAAQIRHFGRPLSMVEEEGLEYHESTVPTSPRYSASDIPDIIVNESPLIRNKSTYGGQASADSPLPEGVGPGFGGYSPQRKAPDVLRMKKKSWFTGWF